MVSTSLNSGTRLGTMIMDHIIMCVICTVVAAPWMVYDMMQTFGNPGSPPKLLMGNMFVNLLAFSLYLNKDAINGRSPAKRIFKLQVIHAGTGLPANPLRCLVRNLTLIIWPVEVIAGLINNERRIGDYIAGTRLIPYNPDTDPGKVNWPLVFVAVLLSAGFIYLAVYLPLGLLFRNSNIDVG